MKHVITLTSDELEVVLDCLDMADHLVNVDTEMAQDIHYRLDEQMQMELEEEEPWE